MFNKTVFNGNEVAMLLLCIGVFVFIINKRKECKRIPHWGLLLTSFCIFFAAVICTVAEEVIFPDSLNILEHVLYMCSSFMIMLWCWMIFRYRKGAE